MKKIYNNQMSETIILNLILALSGGAMDSYSYIYRGKVFANAQTGNIILFGINISRGNYKDAIRFLFPIIAFVLGIVIADIIRIKIKEESIHWRQISIVMEIFLLFISSFISRNYNQIANFLISFACGIQVESFRSVRGNSVATTMCIGNLRNGTNYLDKYIVTRNAKFLKKSIIYFLIILFFAIGAIIESILIEVFYNKSIIFSVILLFVGFIIMNIEE
ncbi:MAG: YoaK family protein [Tissierellia bacterium]|nr:YoaK family protein [Tissierellia bacterium]